jgi:DNA-directed RNA polymerase specialized sigma24 family protein
MSAALQYHSIFAAAASMQAVRREIRRGQEQQPDPQLAPPLEEEHQPVLTLAFYRKHTEAMLRRYLYASMLVGRAPSLLDHPVARGWASSRPVRTFEEAVNYVLDIEASLAQLNALDRCLLNRVILQEYTETETAAILNINVNTVAARLRTATDQLTEILLKEGLLVLPL